MITETPLRIEPCLPDSLDSGIVDLIAALFLLMLTNLLFPNIFSSV